MNLKKFKALVIDDENDIRKELIQALNDSEEIEVVGEAHSIDSAYELITSTPSDVIFLDIKLIGGNSLDLILQLKKYRIPLPPVVVTTGFRDFDDAKRIHNELNEEVITIINKPFWKKWPTYKVTILSHLYNRRIQKNHKYNQDNAIVIPDGRQLIHIHPENIVSIKTGEKRHGKTIIILSNSDINCSLTLVQMMEKLPDYFFQISRYECININQILLYNQTERELTMKSGYKTQTGVAFHPLLIELLSGVKQGNE